MKSKHDHGDFLANLNAGYSPNRWAAPYPMSPWALSGARPRGKVVITADIAQIGESHQVENHHKLDFLHAHNAARKPWKTQPLKPPCTGYRRGPEALCPRKPHGQLFRVNKAR